MGNVGKLRYLPLVGAVLFAVLNTAINNYWGTNQNVIWWLTVLLFLVQIGIQEYELANARNAKPNLVLKNYGLEIKVWSIGFYTVCAFIEVANEPKSKNHTIINSEKVLADIRWFDADRQSVDKNPGRWLIPTADQEGGIKQQTVDLDANGMSRKLHFTYTEEGKYEIESLWRNHDGQRETKARGNPSGYYITISLRDTQSSSATYYFKITPQSKEAYPKKAIRLQQLSTEFGNPISAMDFDLAELHKYAKEHPVDFGM